MEHRLQVLQPYHDSDREEVQWVISEQAVAPESLSKVISTLPHCCYAFLHERDYTSESTDRERILDHFGVPRFVANRTCTEINGFFGHQVSYKYGDEGEEQNAQATVSSCSTWFRCLFKMIRKVERGAHEDGPEYVPDGKKGYTWFEMSVFTRWDAHGGCQVLCIDAPPDFPTELRSALARRREPFNIHDPFAMHADLWDRIVVYYDISVWRVRDPVRLLEKTGPTSREVFQPARNFTRHAIHVSEVLESAVATAVEMRRCQAETSEILAHKLENPYQRQVDGYTMFQISLLRNLKLRSDSNKTRLDDMVHNAFNNLSMQDNNMIRSITVVTLLCLPTSLISSIFSTTFFSYGEKSWEVSDQLWIYWATVIPVTIAIFLTWGLWYRKGDSMVKWFRALAKRYWKNRDGSRDVES